MKLLDDIPSFPATARDTLHRQYGIDSAEAFYGHAVQDSDGMRQALHVSARELNRLVRMAESFLDPDFAACCREPAVSHPRGVIVKGRGGKR